MRDRTYRYLALGDSYTCAESLSFEQSFPHLLHERLAPQIEAPTVLAQTGWTARTLNRKIEEAQGTLPERVDLITLLIGVNDQYRGRTVEAYAAELEKLLAFCEARLGGSRRGLVMMSIPDYSHTPFAQKMDTRAEIWPALQALNAKNRSVADAHSIPYVDVTTLSRERTECVSSDGLHPSPDLYVAWVDALAPVVTDVLSRIP